MSLKTIRILQFFLLLFISGIYIKTLPPSILWVDSGTMIAASYTLGIPNPPGFPFYILVSHLFTFLPFGSVLFRLELFSIVCGIATLVLLYKSILLLLQNHLYFDQRAKRIDSSSSDPHLQELAATFATVALAFSYQFWSQTQNTDAFIFTDFFLSIFLYLTLKVSTYFKRIYLQEQSRDISLYAKKLFATFLLIAFLYGLASGANPTITQFVPSVLLVLYINRKFLPLKKLLVLGAVFFSTMVSLYMYLPIRAKAHPFVNWGDPQSLPNVLHHLFGEGLNVYAPEASLVNGFTGSPTVILHSLFYYVWLVFVQFTPFLLPFLMWGLYSVWKRNRLLFSFLLLPVLFNVLYGSLYFSGNQESWFIASYMIFSVFMGVGFYVISQKLLALKKNNSVVIVLFLLCLLPLIFWFQMLNRSWHYVTTDYGNNLYKPLAKNALLLGIGDLFGSQSYYLHEVEKIRPDVTPIIWNQFYYSQWMRDNIRRKGDIVISSVVEELMKSENRDTYNKAANQFFADNIDKHPMYVSPFLLESSIFPGDPRGFLQLDSRFKSIPHGLVQRIVKKNDPTFVYFDSFDFHFLTPGFPKNSPKFLEKTYSRLESDVMYQYGRALQAAGDYWLTEKNNGPNALYWYIKAREYQPYNPEILLRFGYVYTLTDQFDAARQYFEKAVSLNFNNPNYHYYLANAYINLGMINEAKQEEATLEQLDTNGQLAKAIKEMIRKAAPQQEQKK